MGNGASVIESDTPKRRSSRRASNFIGAGKLRRADAEKRSVAAPVVTIDKQFQAPTEEFVENTELRRSSLSSTELDGDNVIHDDLINKDDDEVEANVLLDYITQDNEYKDVTVPVGLKWKGNAKEVFVVGSFTNWRTKLQLNKIGESEFAVQLFLRIGFYRFQFIVDGEIKCSNNLPKATEANGNLVNWFEVVRSEKPAPVLTVSNSGRPRTYSITKPAQHNTGKVVNNTNDDYFGPISEDQTSLKLLNYRSYTVSNEALNEYKKINNPILTPVPKKSVEYTTEIPPIYTETDDFDETVTDSSTFLKMKKIPEPPSLPPYLNNVLLNKREKVVPAPPKSPSSNPTNDANVLSVPNHVILNHLITTSIKNNVLAVACINRYAGKFITQVTYSPIETKGSE